MQRIQQSGQIGRILVDRRKKLGISQAVLAAKMAMSQQRLSELEKEPGGLTVERLTVWLRLLNLDLTIAEAASADKIAANKKSVSKAEW
jgi:HTH-type transcriptional regulator/antitoxin HipB